MEDESTNTFYVKWCKFSIRNIRKIVELERKMEIRNPLGLNETDL